MSGYGNNYGADYGGGGTADVVVTSVLAIGHIYSPIASGAANATVTSLSVTGWLNRVRGLYSHSPISKPDTRVYVKQNRLAIQANLRDLEDVDTTATRPVPTDMAYLKDQRFELVYNPISKKWIASPEPVVTGIDGGQY